MRSVILFRKTCMRARCSFVAFTHSLVLYYCRVLISHAMRHTELAKRITPHCDD